ncbi:ATP-binding protein [Clostridium vincentii]|uniref:Circadian input-output histidine kinase CikA n=1 Tax=Clostridium vincentii TaxID=52704 RepID=A0A2T0BDW1_9CLOT|nr:ATP-binding protein [Clostridium vincentii]PRR82065.1 Autoinducer 2 sensor kinase/phosphatase LuxQ [Clostridium vincentii]
MSHEIRTPMNAIMGLAHIISQSDLNDLQKNYISKIEQSSKILLRIINDILDFSKIEAKKLEIENINFNLDTVFDNITTLYTPSATAKGIDINFDIYKGVPNVLKGDPLRLEQIISNLTTNAIKFTSQGEVNVLVRIADETENKVSLNFSVTDTGIGLTKEQIERLFTAFTQADNSTTRKYGGTGLGLTITKQLVDLMDGSIWIESKLGEGSTFQFIIQFDKVPTILILKDEEYNGESLKKFQRALKDKQILLVEDNDINQLVAKSILEQAGICVSIASNGEEAIKHIRANKFDAVLMDVQMPIMDGYKATEILRETYSRLELPIISMTANALNGDRERSIKSGMNDYISKPINPDILFRTLVKWLPDTSPKVIENPLPKISNENVEILDFNRTLLRLGNKKVFYYDLLNRYCSTYSNLVNEFSDMRINKQYTEAKRFIHSLKGVTGNIGAIELNRFIIQFEEQYESYDDDSLNKELVALSALNGDLIDSIKKVVPKKVLEKKQLSSNFNIQEALNKLLEALQKARAKEIKENMSYLSSNTEDTNFIVQINEIKILVGRYRFKEAKSVVEDLITIVKESDND